MEKYVAIVFDNETKAYEGAEALRALHRSGDITVYSAAVLGKNDTGRTEIKKTKDDGPFGTAVGLALGGLIGAMVGPATVAAGAAAASATVAQAAAGGMLAGSATGGFIGMFRDLWTHDVDTAVLDRVSSELNLGDYCIVASVEETWTTPLDSRMNALDGIVFRKSRFAVEDETYEAEIRALNQELDELEEELRQAHQDNKASIQAKIDNVKGRIQDNNARISDKIAEWDADLEERLMAIDEQIENASEARRQKFIERREQLKANHEARKERFRQQRNVTREVLAA